MRSFVQRVYGAHSWKTHCVKVRKAEFGRGQSWHEMHSPLRRQATLWAALEWTWISTMVPYWGQLFVTRWSDNDQLWPQATPTVRHNLGWGLSLWLRAMLSDQHSCESLTANIFRSGVALSLRMRIQVGHYNMHNLSLKLGWLSPANQAPTPPTSPFFLVFATSSLDGSASVSHSLHRFPRTPPTRSLEVESLPTHLLHYSSHLAFLFDLLR